MIKNGGIKPSPTSSRPDITPSPMKVVAGSKFIQINSDYISIDAIAGVFSGDQLFMNLMNGKNVLIPQQYKKNLFEFLNNVGIQVIKEEL